MKYYWTIWGNANRIVVDYLLYFSLTFVFSTLFGVIGLGSSLVLIPALSLLGIEFNFAKAIGLFVNGITTLSITIKNLKSGAVSFVEILPYLTVSIIFSYIGAYATIYVSENIVQILLFLFIFLSVAMMFIHLEYKTSKQQRSHFLIGSIISCIAFIGGLLGVGGGAAYLPLFMLLGIDPKRSISLTSVLIPFVSFSGFASYATFIQMDWVLLGIVGVAAMLGGIVSHTITNKISNEKFLKIFIAVILLGVGIAMIIKALL